MRHAIALLAIALLFAVAAPAHAAQRRYAVVIGNNVGAPSDAPLRYAERDASRVASTLRKYAGVASEDLTLVVGATAQDTERALRRTVATMAAGDDTVLFVYYSGHGDGASLHLRGTQLQLDTLRGIISQASATVRVLVIDACQSGGLTRVKGATPAAPFAITADDRLDTEGVAIITSSAADEDSQESERLRGGVFTHHLLSGLRGAADVSGDHRVTLREAYDYAYDQTLRASTRTRAPQHPTFAFELRGRQDLVVTRVSGAHAGRVRFDTAGEFSVLDEGEGRLIAEVTVSEDNELALEPGDYVIRLRTDDAVLEIRISVRPGQVTVLQLSDMRPMRYRDSAAKHAAPSGPPGLAYAVEPPAQAHWFAAGALGTGAGYINGGTTEGAGDHVACCAAFETVNYRVEFGAWIAPRWTLSMVARVNETAANVQGHSTGAPALLARATHTGTRGLLGWSWHADAGYGVIRHGVVLADPDDPDGNIDTHAMGPVLLGGGARFAWRLTDGLQLTAGAAAWLGVPVLRPAAVDAQRGLAIDINVGVAWVAY